MSNDRTPRDTTAEKDWITLLSDNGRTGGQGARPFEAPSRALAAAPGECGSLGAGALSRHAVR